MGQVFSTSTSAKNTPASTPQRAPNCADPRSPSRDIERTPITVNTPINSNDENSITTGSTIKDEKPRKRSLRETMLERMLKNNNSNKSENPSQSD